MTIAFCKQTHTLMISDALVVVAYSEWFSLGSLHTVCVVGMFHVNAQSMHLLISLLK